MGLEEDVIYPSADQDTGIKHAKTQKRIALALVIPTLITQIGMWINGFHLLFDPRDNLICFAMYGGCAKLYNDANKTQRILELKYLENK